MSVPDNALKNITAVVITGGSSGIGKSFIELCGRLRPEVWFCNLSRSQPHMDRVELKLRHIPCDLSDSGQLQQAIPAVEDFLRSEVPSGQILLINNSGFGSYGPFPEPAVVEQLQMVDLNVRAVLHLTGALLPILKQRGGAIINVASTASFQPTAYMATYGATKAFLLHWSLALNEELRDSGVHALALCPGPTTTAFFRRAGLREGSVADSLSESSERVVEVALRALAARKAVVVSGWKNRFLAAVVTKLPKTLATRVTAAVLRKYRLGKKA